MLFNWKIKEKVFQCQIHDNGPGFKGLSIEKFTTLEVLISNLNKKKIGMGLTIINKTILDSGGHLFFSRSKKLKGTMVYIEFPVFDFKNPN